MGKPVLIVALGACICLALVALVVVYKGDVTAQRGNPAGAAKICDVPQAISKEDHKFLDDLFQQQNQEPVPRAELIVNTSQVKRAQLVVNSRVVERAEPARPRRQ
jgi:negative regulator of sigma E activity